MSIPRCRTSSETGGSASTGSPSDVTANTLSTQHRADSSDRPAGYGRAQNIDHTEASRRVQTGDLARPTAPRTPQQNDGRHPTCPEPSVQARRERSQSANTLVFDRDVGRSKPAFSDALGRVVSITGEMLTWWETLQRSAPKWPFHCSHTRLESRISSSGG